MSAEMDSSIDVSTAIIYVRLLNEGVEVYRPVPATPISDFTFRLDGGDIYDPADEEWEFPPGSLVVVQQRVLDGETVLVATSSAQL